MLPLIMPILSLIAKPIVGWFTHKAEMQKAKQAAEIEWAKEMAKASGKSWKDEYLTILWTLPIVLGMFGYTAPLEKLLLILKQIPEWYTYLLLVITLASFGLSVTGRWQDIKMVKEITTETAREKRLNGQTPTGTDHGTDFELTDDE